ncbi:MAG: helix-turn-helix domain-containing protein [Lachnospiraceae bacterium]
MDLGINIKSLRKEKGLTQEQLAYELGVSPQAISRWENNITYPDISMLPMLADYFEVSLDRLMGRGKECNVSERERFFKEVRLCEDKYGTDKAIIMYRNMLEKYPLDVYIQFGLCNALYLQYKYSHDKNIEKEIFVLCNKINKSNMPDMQCGARRLLVLMHVQNGEYEKAKKLVNELPSFRCGRELMIAEVLSGDEKIKCIEGIIDILRQKIYTLEKTIEMFSAEPPLVNS